MNSRKKYGAAGHYFHSCANKETTDHYLQSCCANKNPRATIRTAALPIRIHVSLIRTAALRITASFHYLAPLVLLCVSVELYFSASGFMHTSSFSSSCEATAIVELIILSFHVGSVAGGKKRRRKKEKSFGLLQSGDP